MASQDRLLYSCSQHDVERLSWAWTYVRIFLCWIKLGLFCLCFVVYQDRHVDDHAAIQTQASAEPSCLHTFKHHALTHFTHSHTYAGSCQALYTHISMSSGMSSHRETSATHFPVILTQISASAHIHTSTNQSLAYKESERRHRLQLCEDYVMLMLCDSSTWCYVILVWWKQLLGEILRIPEEPRKSECSWHFVSSNQQCASGDTCHDQCSSVPELPLPNTISCISTVLTAPFVLEGTPRSPWHTNLLPEHRRSWAKSLGRLSSGFWPLTFNSTWQDWRASARQIPRGEPARGLMNLKIVSSVRVLLPCLVRGARTWAPPGGTAVFQLAHICVPAHIRTCTFDDLEV